MKTRFKKSWRIIVKAKRGKGHPSVLRYLPERVGGDDDFPSGADRDGGKRQRFLDAYTKAYGGEIDYVHGEEVVSALSQKRAQWEFCFRRWRKETCLKRSLPKALCREKPFLGEASEKRYYLECHKINKKAPKGAFFCLTKKEKAFAFSFLH